MKWLAFTIGGVIAVAHIGVLGHLIKVTEKVNERPQYPNINLPTGEYSSYKINVDRDGYQLEYKADDPKILSSERSLDLDKEKRGLFGGSSEQRTEYRRDEYTRKGTRNMGGAVTQGEEGKSAKDIECIVADAGARSQGAMAGAAISAGAIAPAVVGIPYIGWLAAGWAALLGQRAGSEIGSQVGEVFNDC